MKNLWRVSLALALFAPLTGCEEDGPIAPDPGPGEICTPAESFVKRTEGVRSCDTTIDPVGYPTLSGPCVLGVANPTRMLITTTDWATGSVSVADLAAQTVEKDVAVGGTDVIPYYHDGNAYMVHRLGDDFVNVLDPANSFAPVAQHPIEVCDVPATNPQSVAFRSDGLAFVPSFDTPLLQVHDFSAAAGETLVAGIDLSPFADTDGNPDAQLAVACGDTVFVVVRRLDRSGDWWVPVDTERLVPIDGVSCKPYDTPPVELQGHYPRQFRLDPRDASGQTLLVLDDGIERVQMATGTVDWAVADTLFTDAGIAGYQLLSFDVTDTGTLYIAAATADFSAVNIYTVTLDGTQQLTALADAAGTPLPFGGAERTLEVIGTTLWFGNTAFGQEGLMAYDISQDPPVLLAGPIDTGLPPYSAIPIP